MARTYHTIDAIDGGALPGQSDRLLLGSAIAVAFFASAASITSVGTIVPGSAYLAPVTLAFAGGTGSGGAALPILKALTVSSIIIGGSGYAANDTITLPGGAVVTVSTVASGVITAATVTTAGSITNPQAGSAVQVSTSGSGSGAAFVLTYGLLGVQMMNSGNYSVVPTGITLTGSGGSGTGASGVPALGGNGAAVFVSPPGLSVLPASYFVDVSPSVPAFSSVPYKGQFGFAVALTPIAAASTLAAGTVDVLLWA